MRIKKKNGIFFSPPILKMIDVKKLKISFVAKIRTDGATTFV